MVIRKPTTGANTVRTVYLSRTIQTGITRTGIRNRTLPIDTPTPGLIRLIGMTNPGTVTVSDATGSVAEFVCDSFRESSLDTP
jgi:hypothetical protein